MYDKAKIAVKVTCGRCGAEGEVFMDLVFDPRLNLITLDSLYPRWDEAGWKVAGKVDQGYGSDTSYVMVRCPECQS